MYKQKFILILMTVMLLITTTVYADELTFYYKDETENVTYPQGALKIEAFEDERNSNQFFSLNSTEVMDFEEYIKMNLKEHNTEIDVSMYNMKLGNFIAKVSEYCDESMIATGLVSYSVEEAVGLPEFDKKITSWKPVYLFSSEKEAEHARTFVRQEVLKYANEVRELTEDPLGQLLLAHDMLVKNCEYDVDCIDKIDGNDNIQSFSVYGLFKNKIAVCQGYSEAFYLIAEELGYNCGFNVSYEIGHIWNYIEIDNEFYQVDMTWNDPVYNRTDNADGSITVGYHTTLADHIYFLCSDTLIAGGHGTKDTWYQSMETKPDCGSKYEGGYLFNIVDPFATEFANGKYVVNTTMIRNDGEIIFNATFKTDNLQTGDVIPSVMTADDNNYYCVYYFTKLTSGFDLYLGQYKEDKLLFGAKIGTLSNSLGRGSIFGCSLTKSKILSECDNFKTFMWNRSEMTPLSVPVGNIR